MAKIREKKKWKICYIYTYHLENNDLDFFYSSNHTNHDLDSILSFSKSANQMKSFHRRLFESDHLDEQ